MVGSVYVLGWVGAAFHLLCVTALVLAVAVYAKRIGGVGPWLVGLVGLFDLVLTLAFTLLNVMSSAAHIGYSELESVYTALGVVDLLSTLISAAVVVAGFAMMRKPPAGAG
jgi:hypothetical protein